MENVNLNFSGKDNIIKSICWIFSVLGWLMYLICGWISLKWLDDGINVFGSYEYDDSANFHDYWDYWCNQNKDACNNLYGGIVMTIPRRPLYKYPLTDKKYGEIYPLQVQTSVIYIILILTMVFALFGFIVYMIKSTYKKEGAVFDGMMGDWTRLHSIPLFIAAGLFLIGICLFETKNAKWKDANIAGIVLVILGLASLIFIYIKTDLPDDWITASIKKGAYSTLIALEWYYFCYLICNLAIIDLDLKDVEYKQKYYDIIENCGIAMPIIEGMIALVFAFFFKDVIIALMNVVIFAGAMGYYLSIHEDYRKKDFNLGGHGDTEGIIDLVFLILSIVVIVLLIIMKKKECLK